MCNPIEGCFNVLKPKIKAYLSLAREDLVAMLRRLKGKLLRRVERVANQLRVHLRDDTCIVQHVVADGVEVGRMQIRCASTGCETVRCFCGNQFHYLH
ncbi:hypothetical protein PI124_g18856 [Phytophthora idaei]|nr:hypothetical protein PI126_g18194 [Phytophthora idaei]KAG3236131.1 hypothetical protein PI124_g18856 [Phytophthora idaei]